MPAIGIGMKSELDHAEEPRALVGLEDTNNRQYVPRRQDHECKVHM